jgi:hypothetical protein
MKKIFYLLFAVSCIIACTEQNTPVNPENDNTEKPGENPNNDSNEPEVGKKSPKYLSTSETVTTFLDTTKATSGNKVGDVTRIVYERGTDVRFLLSQTTYSNSDLHSKISYQNVGNADYGVYTEFPGSEHLVGLGADTTFWYDEDRTLPSKIINGSSVTNTTYNDKGLITSNITYVSGKKVMENQFTYSSNVRYGTNTSFYNEEPIVYYDTMIFEDIDKGLAKQYRYYYCTETDTYISSGRTIIEYTNGIYGIEHQVQETYSKLYIKDNGNETITHTKNVSDYSYQDEMHVSINLKIYNDGQLLMEQIHKQVYVR